jgi:hypothetical protein
MTMRLAKHRQAERPTHGGPVPAPLPTPALTNSQAAFLVGLTPAQRSGLKCNPKLEKLLLGWFRDGSDPILRAEASRLVQPLGSKSDG